MANITDKPLLSIKEVIYILGAASAVLFYSNRIESKIDKLTYMYQTDKLATEAKFIDITGQLADLKRAVKAVEMIRPEETTITRRRK